MKDDDLRIIIAISDEISNKLLKTSQKALLNIYEKLTISEANAIYAIGPDEPKTMKQIAETLGVAVSTPTRIIDKLVEKGFVNRSVGTKDRRQLLIELSQNGKTVLAEMDKEGLEMTKKLLNNLSDEEIEAYKNILLKIRDNMD